MSSPVSLAILFQEEIPNDCVCPICEQALRAPVRTPCGHHFCEECLTPQMNCVICGELVGVAERDKDKQKQVQQLLVFCSFKNIGCEWEGPLYQLQGHAMNCEKRQEQCTSCGKMFDGKEFEEHVKSCQVIPCEYCESLVKAGSFERHLQKCKLVIINCPYQCGFNNKTRAEVEQHYHFCPRAGNVCPFDEIGCDFVGDRESVQRHLREEPVKHLVLMCDEMTSIKRASDMAEEDLLSLEGRHAEMCRKVTICERMYGAQLVWRIDNVLTKTNEAKSGSRPAIYSSAFGSGRFGYKLVASCCLFGDKNTRGDYMAVYLTILRGEFDDILEWPFQMTVRFILLDQNPIVSQRVNVAFVVDCRQLAKSNQHLLGKPTGERNASFGAQRFCKLEKLQQYVKDDTFFLQVEVEQPVGPPPQKKNFRVALTQNETEGME